MILTDKQPLGIIKRHTPPGYDRPTDTPWVWTYRKSLGISVYLPAHCSTVNYCSHPVGGQVGSPGTGVMDGTVFREILRAIKVGQWWWWWWWGSEVLKMGEWSG